MKRRDRVRRVRIRLTNRNEGDLQEMLKAVAASYLADELEIHAAREGDEPAQNVAPARGPVVDEQLEQQVVDEATHRLDDLAKLAEAVDAHEQKPLCARQVELS